MTQRGYFEIGIYRGKTPANIGTLWRSAYQLGASGIFTIGERYPKQASDTMNTWKHIPLRQYETFDDFLKARPHDCQLIGIEMGGEMLPSVGHPQRAIYLLGSEDNGLPEKVQAECQKIISLPSIRTASFNVSVAGSLVMMDRLTKGEQ